MNIENSSQELPDPPDGSFLTQEKFTSTYGWLWPMIFRYLCRCLDRWTAEDLAQETMWRVYNFYRFTRGASVSTFAYRVARNLSISWMRRAEFLLNEPFDLVTHADAFVTDVLHDQYEAAALLERARREALGPEQNAIIQLYMDGWKAGEIAELWGIREGAVQARLSRAKATLREKLEEQDRKG